ncbi:hypothetical protein ABKN59_011474 [Abortiporus biennis]
MSHFGLALYLFGLVQLCSALDIRSATGSCSIWLFEIGTYRLPARWLFNTRCFLCLRSRIRFKDQHFRQKADHNVRVYTSVPRARFRDVACFPTLRIYQRPTINTMRKLDFFESAVKNSTFCQSHTNKFFSNVCNDSMTLFSSCFIHHNPRHILNDQACYARLDTSLAGFATVID